MTYNLHCHLHLPLQVLLYGPLHMVSCFPFEGFFKICHGLYHGTRAITEQIIRNLNLMQFIGNYKFFNNFQIKENHEFRKIYNKLQLTTNNLHTNKYGLVNFTSKPIQNLTANEQTLLININKGLIASNLVKHSYRFVKDSTEFASYITQKQNIMTQNYAICYESQSNIKFGLIKNFLQINDDNIYCVIRNISKKSRFCDDEEIETYLNKFYLIGNLEETFSIINVEQIVNKCTLLKNSDLNEIFVSRCTELKEHN